MPADDDTTTLRTPAARAASSIRTVPMALISASSSGWSIERLLPTEAARWNTASQPWAARFIRSASRISPTISSTPSSASRLLR